MVRYLEYRKKPEENSKLKVIAVKEKRHYLSFFLNLFSIY
jgi:hypothetical protein